MAVLIAVAPLDPVTSTRPVLRFCDADDERLTALDDETWWPGITAAPSLNREGWNGDFSGVVALAQAGFDIRMTALKKVHATAPALRWAGARVDIWRGEAGQAFDAFDLLFTGFVTSYDLEGEAELRITARVDSAPFERNMLEAVYAGTGDAEGGADLKDKSKPAVFGNAMNVEPVTINEVDNVFQVHGYGAIEGIAAVYERAASFGASLGDHEDYEALVAADIPEGAWATCLAEGMFRLGAPPAGVVTADVQGDAVGGFHQSTAEVIARLCEICDVDGGRIDSASLAALDTAVPAPINLYLTSPEKLIDLIQRLAQPCNAQAALSWTGQLQITRFGGIGTPAMTLDGQGRALPPVAGVSELNVSPPYHRIEMLAARCWRVHSYDEIATYAPLIERGNYAGTAIYREGNIVLNQGSTWLYINETPGSGNAPPSLPTTENAYWRVMAVAGPTGPSGVNNAIVYLYRRSATTPADPSGTFTYTFATGVLSGGTLNGASQTIPAADGNPLWVKAATASSSGATDSIPASEFSGWVQLVVDGVDGLNTATVWLFQRNDTGIAPSGIAGSTTYTFATGALSGSLGAWSQADPGAASGRFLFYQTATALGTAATDSISSGEWASPRLMVQGLSDQDIERLDHAADDGWLTGAEKRDDVMPAFRQLEARHRELAARALALGIGPSVENLINRSEEVGSWGLGSGVTVEANVAANPFDGAMTADRVNGLLSAVGDRVSRLAYSGQNVFNRRFIGSIWLKGEGANIGKQLNVMMKRATGATGVFAPVLVTLTGEWQEVEGHIYTAGDSVGVFFGFNVGGTGDPWASSVLVWGGQVVEGYHRLPYVLTGASTQALTSGSAVADAATAAWNRLRDTLINSEAAIFSKDSPLIPGENLIPLNARSVLANWVLETGITVRGDGPFTRIVEANASTTPAVYRNVVTGGANNRTFTFLAKFAKDSVGRATRFPSIRINFTGGTTTLVEMALDTQTGEFSQLSTTNAANPSCGVIDLGDSWLAWVSARASAANVNAVAVLLPVRGASAGWAVSAAATGEVNLADPQMFEGTIEDIARLVLQQRFVEYSQALDALAAELTKGQSIVELTVYKRDTSPPSTPSGGSYDFDTHVLTPPSGYTRTWPTSGSGPVYAASGVAAIVGFTGTAVPDWLGVGKVAEDGSDGDPGDPGAATNVIFRRGTSAPATPSPSSGVPANFYDDAGDVPGGDGYIYAFFGTRPDPSSNWTWQDGKRVEGADGADGYWTDTKFIRSLSRPATPTGDSPTGYSDGIPPGTDTIWQVNGRKTFAGALIGSWSAPEQISGLTHRGTYSDAATYYVNNTVTFNGGTYIATQDNFDDEAPSGTAEANSYWDVIAAPGAPGEPATPPSAFNATIDLTSLIGTTNLRTIANANGYTGLSDATITFRVPNGVTLRGLTGGNGIDTGTWPTGSYAIDIEIVVQSGGIVDGGGGKGGDGGSYGQVGLAGGKGGDAIYCRLPCDVTINSGGTVRAAGGGGAGGASIEVGWPEPTYTGGGGGGGGAPNGSGGVGGWGDTQAAGGSAGTTGGGGAGGGNGANGGGYNTAGQASGGTGGGAAGYAVRKNGHTVTVTNNGTMTGTAG